MNEILSGCHKKTPEYYDRLGCDRNSTIEQITAEYRARVRDCHPDKAGTESNDAFLALQRAFNVLSDPQQRSVYDMWLDSPLPMDFDEFYRNSQALKMSMHWVTPKTTPQIAFPRSQKTDSRWTDRRYETETTRRFRNYEI